ncbi:hypothetical protein T484DRAFT_1841312 [Baffinella frigidus]|nr:hypothetical protein T484DRAFT_1841312 [Cryptophyta sp. CCMP2293]
MWGAPPPNPRAAAGRCRVGCETSASGDGGEAGSGEKEGKRFLEGPSVRLGRMVRALLVALAVLSGARACDPPIFVASPSATAPGLFPPGNRFCALQRPCHLPLFARDAEGAAESGILAILWAASPEGEFSGGGGMLRIDGAECSGNGSLACIFQPQGDLLNLEAPATLTRCFAVERVSGGGGVCRSPTVCLDIFIEESSAEERVSLDLHSHAEVAIAAAGGDAGCAAVPPDERVPIVRLAWTSALSASEASPALIQHSLDGGASFSDVPAVCVSGSTAVVPAAILLAHAGAPSVELVFRVVVATPTGRRFGLQSNAVFLRRREARAGTLFGATWEGQVMRAHRRGGEGGEVGELAQVLSAPVMKGAFAVDALNQRVYTMWTVTRMRRRPW